MKKEDWKIVDQPTITTIQYFLRHIEHRLVLYVANKKSLEEVPE